MILSRAEFESHLPDFIELSTICFGKEIPECFWRWRYLDPNSEFIAVNVELQDGKVIANYSASTLILSYMGVDYRFLFSMSTMTHPSHSGKGLFTKLAEELYRAAEERGYVGVLGFPNRNSHSGFRQRLQWADIYEVPTLRLKLPKARHAVGERSKARTTSGPFPDVCEPTWLAQSLHVKRTAAYMKWRFLEHPINDYSVWRAGGDGSQGAYAVTKWYEDQLDIVEFMALDERQAESILQNILSFAVSESASQINVWIPVHAPYRAPFEKAGFDNGEPVTYFGGRIFGGQTALFNHSTEFFNFKNWYIQMSDSDVY